MDFWVGWALYQFPDIEYLDLQVSYAAQGQKSLLWPVGTHEIEDYLPSQKPSSKNDGTL